jgi:metal-responsive CopG/Arc/MetJ family transcriptional regulator
MQQLAPAQRRVTVSFTIKPDLLAELDKLHDHDRSPLLCRIIREYLDREQEKSQQA